MTLHLAVSESASGRSSPRRLRRRVLVATDGTPASAGALSVANELARRDGATVDVVSVIKLWDRPVPSHELSGETAEAAGQRLARVLPQLRGALAATAKWRLRIMEGDVAPSITSAIAAKDYDLVIVGSRRRWLDRLLGRSTALRVAELAPIPVLAVPPAVRTLPRRAVVGFGGGRRGTAAAQAALGLVDVPATVHAVRVVDPAQRRGAAAAHEPAEARARDAALLAVSPIPGIDGAEAIVIRRTVLRSGDPAAALTAFAGATGADLIALGIGRTKSLRDRVLGGTCGRVLRSAECCVLLSGN